VEAICDIVGKEFLHELSYGQWPYKHVGNHSLQSQKNKSILCNGLDFLSWRSMKEPFQLRCTKLGYHLLMLSTTFSIIQKKKVGQ
jgi:hypothetical protein